MGALSQMECAAERALRHLDGVERRECHDDTEGENGPRHPEACTQQRSCCRPGYWQALGEKRPRLLQSCARPRPSPYSRLACDRAWYWCWWPPTPSCALENDAGGEKGPQHLQACRLLRCCAWARPSPCSGLENDRARYLGGMRRAGCASGTSKMAQG